jgi:hypothetical protein
MPIIRTLFDIKGSFRVRVGFFTAVRLTEQPT